MTSVGKLSSVFMVAFFYGGFGDELRIGLEWVLSGLLRVQIVQL